MADYFPSIDTIPFQGPNATTPLAFRHYNADEIVDGKTMKDHLRFAAAYWHCFCNGGADQFGAPTRQMPWEDADPMQTARNKVDANFELCTKLGIGFYCFHDTDVAPEGKTLAESFSNFDTIASYLKMKQDETGVKLLWATANCFSNPRFVHGAGTSPNADAFAYAAAKIAKAIEVTHMLGGDGYVFWGGREGYKTLLNTDMGRELDHLAALLTMAVEHKKKIDFTGQFYIEPKPKEPTKHQYDSDAAACYAFLQKYGLENDFKMNIEANHATLAGHDFQHELEFSALNGILGSVDANRGDLMLGWDTDQFPTDIRETTLAMLSILGAGGFTTGGLNFDAHVARESIEPVDLFHAHIGAMDAFARGLKNAAAIRAGGQLDAFKKERYASWDSGIGAQIEAGQLDMDGLKTYMLDKGEIDANTSGRVEMLENILNDYI
jgi:xylose isomerase